MSWVLPGLASAGISASNLIFVGLRGGILQTVPFSLSPSFLPFVLALVSFAICIKNTYIEGKHRFQTIKLIELLKVSFQFDFRVPEAKGKKETESAR